MTSGDNRTLEEKVLKERHMEDKATNMKHGEQTQREREQHRTLRQAEANRRVKKRSQENTGKCKTRNMARKQAVKIKRRDDEMKPIS